MVFDPVQTIEGKNLIESIGEYFSRVNRFHDVDLLKSKTQVVFLVMISGVVDHFLRNIYARQRSASGMGFVFRRKSSKIEKAHEFLINLLDTEKHSARCF
jgi:hypothetical protein